MDRASGLEDSRIGKSAKVTQACARCRQKKNRCDGKLPSCSNCIARGEDCVYREYQRRRGPGRAKQHVRALEQRLSDLEALLQRWTSTSGSESHLASSSPHHEEGPAGSEPRSSGPALPVEEEAPSTADSTIRGSTTLEVHIENLGIVETAHKRLPLFKMVTENLAEDFDSPAVSQSLKRIPGQHIPVRKAEAILAENTIQEICDDIPLFDVPSFLQWVRLPQTLTQRDNPSQWVCLNATIALAMLIKILNRSYPKVAPVSWAYLKNAYGALPEMMMQRGDNWGAQAALVMAMFMLRASGDRRSAAMFLSVAIGTMQTSGLQPTGDGPDPEVRNGILWAAYILDAEISLNCGIPPLLRDEDINVPVPSQEVTRGTGGGDAPPGSSSTTVFALRTELATIKVRLRTHLYSAKAFRLSDDELIQVISRLASTLDTWRSHVPEDIQPGRHGQMPGAVLQTPVIMFHLAFYNCVSMVHWAVRRHSAWGSVGLTDSCRDQIATSAVRVRTAAMVVVQLLPRMRSKPLTDIWRILPYILAPGLTLLALILGDPTQVQARLNLKMLETLGQHIDTLVNDEGLDLRSVLKGCTAMQEVAREAVDGALSLDVALSSPTYHKVQALLERMTHPMLVVQALLGNIPNRDIEVARGLSAALSMPWDPESPFSPWVPAVMRPGTHGFKYDLTG